MKQKYLYFIIAIIGVLLNYFVINHQYGFIRAVLGILWLTIIPGALYLPQITGKGLVIEKFIYSVLLSISFIIIGGFVFNYLLLSLGVQNPLSEKHVLLFSDLLIVFGIFWSIVKHKNSVITVAPFITWNLAIIPPLTILVLILAGVQQLNNTGINIFSLTGITLIPINILFLISFNKKIPKAIMIISIYLLTLSLLYSYSLRSNYLIGWDIQSEYKILKNTIQLQYWEPQSIAHGYNSSLALTILPSVIANITGIDPLNIFKIIYPAIFAIIAPLIFMLIYPFSNFSVAILSAFFYIAQSQFMQQMPALARQQIAFLLFTAMIYVSFSVNLTDRAKRMLVLLFGISMVVSHYTSAYISIGLLISSYFLHNIIKISYKVRKQEYTEISRISLRAILILFTTTFFWYGIYTGISRDLTNIVSKVLNNLSFASKEETKSVSAKLAIIGTQQTYTSNDLKKIQEVSTSNYHNKVNWVKYFDAESYKQYSSSIIQSRIIPIKSFNWTSRIYTILQVNQKAIKIIYTLTLLVISILYLLNRRRIEPEEFLRHALIMLLFVSLIVVLPYVSINYNIERMYQQALLFISYIVVLGISTVIYFITKRYFFGILITFISFFIYFSGYSGIISQFFGGNPTLNLSNYGEEYDRYYIRKSDKITAEWLQNNNLNNTVIQSDVYGWLRLQAFTGFSKGLLTDIYPSVIGKNTYVFLTYSNNQTKTARMQINGESIPYNLPERFLNDNKSLVYSSKTGKIYR